MTLPASRGWFDSHAHLDDPAWPAEAVIAALRSLPEWTGAVTAGYGPERWLQARQVCAADPRVVRAIGLHPWWLAEHGENERQAAWAQVLAELDADRTICAIGEAGLDKNRKDLMDAASQRRWFALALAEARRRDLAVVLHVVGWHGHALQVLGELGGRWRGVVHRFSGSPAVAAQYQQMGLCISAALEPRGDPAKQAAVAATVAAEHLMIETDWPFLDLDYPQAVARMAALAKTIAEARGTTAADLAALNFANCRRVFRLDSAD